MHLRHRSRHRGDQRGGVGRRADHHLQEGVRLRFLGRGQVGDGRERLAQVVVLRVLHHSHDLVPGPRRARRLLDLEGLAEGIAAAQVLAGESLVDDGHRLGGGGVALVEVPAGHERRPHRLEVAGAHTIEVGIVLLDLSSDQDRLVPAAPADGQDVGLRGRDHAGQAAEGLHDALLDRNLLRVGEARAPHVQARPKDVVGAEPGIDGQQVAQRAHEEERAHNEHERQGHLRDHQAAAQAEALARRGDAAPPGLHRRRRSHVGGADGGGEAEEDAGQNGQTGGEREHAPVRLQVDEQAVALGAQEGHQGRAEPAREQGSRARAEGGDEQALRHELAHDAAAGGADGEADRDLALARAGPGQHQVGEVRAGDEEDESGHGEEDPEGLLVVATQGRDPGAGRERGQRVGKIGLGVAHGVTGRDRRLEDPGRDLRELRGRARDRPTRLDPPDRGQEPPVGLVESGVGSVDGRLRAEGHRDVEAAPDLHSEEAGARHSEDRKRMPVQAQGAADRGGIASQLALPEGMADHDPG